MKALILVSPQIEALVYPPEVQTSLRQLTADVSVHDSRNITSNLSLLQDVDVLFGSWGFPVLDETFLAAAPRLKAVFYAAGTIKSFTPDCFWKSGVIVSSAYAANAIPVTEFTFAQIVLSLKNVWQNNREIRTAGTFKLHHKVVGAYGSTIGLVSLGMIGKMVLQRLRSLDVHVIAYDPYVSEQHAQELGVELCSLEEVFQRSDVISLHTPWLKETENLIRGSHFLSMKPNASFINTSRGAVIHEQEMIGALQSRPDLTALLDVTYPEPPVEGSPLYSLPNVFLTPHIAGSMERECSRMGHYMVSEFRRYLQGEALHWKISHEMSQRMA